jgi:preprotein translocase subunit SecG
VEILTTVLWVLLVTTNVLLVALVLIHRGRGGGITDVFGGGIASGIQSSAVGERNLSRITWGVAIAWAMSIVLLGLITKYVN